MIRQIRNILCATAVLFALAVSGNAVARPHGGAAAASGPCIFNSPGCLVSPGGQFIQPTFFTDVRQSGQAPYVNAAGATIPYPISWDQCGISYGCGAISADAALTNASTITSGTFPGVCNAYSSAQQSVTCNTDKAIVVGSVSGNTLTIGSITSGGPVAIGQVLNFLCDPNGNSYCPLRPTILSGSGTTWTIDGSPITVASRTIALTLPLNISHYKFLDTLLLVSGHGDVNLTDVHSQLDTGHCVNTGNATFTLGFGKITPHSATFDSTVNCRSDAILYKTASDPGLVTMSTSTGAIVNGVYTVTANVGTMARRQFINYAGQGGVPHQMFTADAANPALFSCVDAACVGTKWDITTGFTGCDQLATSCSLDATLNVASITITEGPIQNTNEFAMSGGSGWDPIDIQYVVHLNGGAIFKSSSGGSINFQNNFCDLVGPYAEHNNCIVIQPDPGTTTTIPFFRFKYSVAWAENTSAQGQGTSTGTNFAVSAASAASYAVTQTESTFEKNVFIANTSITPPGSGLATMGDLMRILSQGTSPPFPGHVVTANFIDNLLDDIGAFGMCAIASGIVVDTDNNSGNWNALTAAPVTC